MGTRVVPIGSVLGSHFEPEIPNLAAQRVLESRESEKDSFQQLVEGLRRLRRKCLRVRWRRCRLRLWWIGSRFRFLVDDPDFLGRLFVARSRRDPLWKLFSRQDVAARQRRVVGVSFSTSLGVVFSLDLIKPVVWWLGRPWWWKKTSFVLQCNSRIVKKSKKDKQSRSHGQKEISNTAEKLVASFGGSENPPCDALLSCSNFRFRLDSSWDRTMEARVASEKNRSRIEAKSILWERQTFHFGTTNFLITSKYERIWLL